MCQVSATAIRASDVVASPRTIRVAYVVHTFDIGGLERCVARLANELDRDRFHVAIICLNRSGMASAWIDRQDVSIIGIGKRPHNDWRCVARLARILRAHRADIVHSHNWGTLVEATIARRVARIPIHIHAERGTLLGCHDRRGIRYRLRALLMRWSLWRTSAVVTNAASIARQIETVSGYPSAHVIVVPNGVEAPPATDHLETRIQRRRELGIAQTAFLVGTVGRLHSVKGFDLAIQAIAAVGQSGRDVQFVIVGDGPEAAFLRRLASQLGVAQRIHFAGAQSDVANWLPVMDVFLNSSHGEGMSQSLIEAMSFGLPLIATDVGDSARVVGGVGACGLVIPPNDIAAIAIAIERLAADGVLCFEFQNSARMRYVAEYSIKTMIDAYSHLYGRLVGTMTHNAASADG